MANLDVLCCAPACVWRCFSPAGAARPQGCCLPHRGLARPRGCCPPSYGAAGRLLFLDRVSRHRHRGGGEAVARQVCALCLRPVLCVCAVVALRCVRLLVCVRALALRVLVCRASAQPVGGRLETWDARARGRAAWLAGGGAGAMHEVVSLRYAATGLRDEPLTYYSGA